MVSAIIPAFKEPYLNKTLNSLLASVVGDIEILPVFDGRKPDEPLREDSRIKPIFLKDHVGMRGCINAGLKVAQGEYVMKVDAHCVFGPGFDKILTEDCKENWLMIPRRYVLNEDKWDKDETRPVMDYHYFTFPGTYEQQHGSIFHILPWYRTGRRHLEIDDNLIFQGSFWFANRKYFMDHVGLLDDRQETYGSFIQEQQEIGFKYWLRDGEVKVDKRTWYCHLSKRKFHYDARLFSRRHKKDAEYINGNIWGTKHWMNNEEPNMTHPFSWLIKKFWPITTWPDNWEEKWATLITHR